MTAQLATESTKSSTPGWDVLRALTAWLGVWPSAGTFRVAPSARRVVPGWDGRVQPLVGVAAGPEMDGAVALSVPPLAFPAVSALVDDLAIRGNLADRTALGTRLPAAVGRPWQRYAEGVLRFTTSPTPLPQLGHWTTPDDPRLPAWLRPFGPDVLVAVDGGGRFLAGVGIKRHTAWTHELAVGTASHARARGLARSLVAQAAARVLDDGALPLYLHDDTNTASARAAEAAGFPDRGWRWLGLTQT